MTWRQVGAVFGKSRSAAEAACRRYQGFKHPGRDYSDNGPPIGIEQTEMHHRKHVTNASASLRRAINSLFERMPDRIVRDILCPQSPPTPGTERIYYGQLAQRALAA